jgi:hypothetical protein
VARVLTHPDARLVPSPGSPRAPSHDADRNPAWTEWPDPVDMSARPWDGDAGSMGAEGGQHDGSTGRMWTIWPDAPTCPPAHPRAVTGFDRPAPRVAGVRQQPITARLSVGVHRIHGNMTVMME